MEQKILAKAKAAKRASRQLAYLPTEIKNEALLAMSESLVQQTDNILAQNALDVRLGREKGLSRALIDRLLLTPERIEDMAHGLKELVALPDPVGEIENMSTRPNGMRVGRMRVPLGVVGMIYEARPNVTVDAAGLCLKAGNAIILRGGSEAINSNKVIAEVIATAATKAGIPEGAIGLIDVTDRAAVNILLKLNQYLDVIVPRGGAGLIQTVIQNSTVPVIETGTGNCHVYVDKFADQAMAHDIVVNAKCHRPGVCNAMETLLVHKDIAKEFLPAAIDKLQSQGVEIMGCPQTAAMASKIAPATDEDYATEFLDLKLAVKIVEDLDQAIDHIFQYGTGHTEAIVTENYTHSMRFLQEVDAAAVFINASTRFTDGQQFGFGAEIGISTQKIHARGPMGLKDLTTGKYVILGGGQIRS